MTESCAPVPIKDVISPIYIKLPQSAKPIEAKLLAGNQGDLGALVTLDKASNEIIGGDRHPAAGGQHRRPLGRRSELCHSRAPF
jgi:hypothetical protein